MPGDLPKLVRDRIPEIIEDDGADPVLREAAEGEVEALLADKLVEEAEEFRDDRELEELADVLEVMKRLVEVRGGTWEELDDLRQKKKEERGGFDKGFVLEDVFEGGT